MSQEGRTQSGVALEVGPLVHLPVMVRETMEHLNVRPGGLYIDCTVGAGGHAVEILKAGGPDAKLIGIDWDDAALEEARKRLAPFGDRVTLVRDNFSNLRAILEDLDIDRVKGILMDLGVSSMHLERPERGFSFRFDARLDMRMDRRLKKTARDLVNSLGARELADIFRRYGEERQAMKIARAIEKARERRPIETTVELAEIVERAVAKRKGRRPRIHPATRVFQALRIAVNNELENLKSALEAGIDLLDEGGRLVVISFHSLEDRIVKTVFRNQVRGCICPPRSPVCLCGHVPMVKLLTKKAVLPSRDEVERNPRARSAKLRAVERILVRPQTRTTGP